jgi:hypothetical protein
VTFAAATVAKAFRGVETENDYDDDYEYEEEYEHENEYEYDGRPTTFRRF